MIQLSSPAAGNKTAGNIRDLMFWQRPRSHWTVAVFHLPLALVFGTGMVLPYVVELKNVPMIVCTFRYITGYPCPLCGFTRAFWAIAHGRWPEAMAGCPLAFPVYLFAAAMAAWHIAALLSNVVLIRGPKLRLGRALRLKAVAVVLILFSLNWFYRLYMGLT